MRGRRSPLPLLLVLGGAAACSAFGSSPGAGVEPDAGADAAADGDASGPPPAPPPPADAGDGGTKGDADAAVKLCAPGTHFVCDDFERPTYPDPQWVAPADLVSGGALRIDVGALEATSPADGRARLLHQAVVTGHAVHCAMQVKILAASTPEAWIASIKVDDGGKGYFTVSIHVRADLSFAVGWEGAGSDGTQIMTQALPIAVSPPLTLGAWTAIDLRIGVGASTAEGRGQVGAASNEIDPTAAKALAAFSHAEVAVGVYGLSGSAQMSSWDIEYDDVVCDVTP